MCVGLIVLACCALAPATIAYAQESINQATITGSVLDPQGAAVPGATVSVRQTDTNVTVEAVTEADGRFRF
jgi:transcriptional regulator of nitric oxide reductase